MGVPYVSWMSYRPGQGGARVDCIVDIVDTSGGLVYLIIPRVADGMSEFELDYCPLRCEEKANNWIPAVWPRRASERRVAPLIEGH